MPDFTIFVDAAPIWPDLEQGGGAGQWSGVVSALVTTGHEKVGRPELSDIEEKILKPWTWTDVTWHVWAVTGSGALKLSAAQVTPASTLELDTDSQTNLDSLLDARIAAGPEGRLKEKIWKAFRILDLPDRPGESHEFAYSDATHTELPDGWARFMLADLAASNPGGPFSTGAKVHLLAALRFANADPATLKVVVAPEFKAEGVTYSPSAPIEDAIARWTFDYTGAGGPSVGASMDGVPFSKKPVAADVGFDPSTYFVLKEQAGVALAGDVSEALTRVIGDATNTPQRIANALTVENRKKWEDVKNAGLIHDALFEALRERMRETYVVKDTSAPQLLALVADRTAVEAAKIGASLKDELINLSPVDFKEVYKAWLRSEGRPYDPESHVLSRPGSSDWSADLARLWVDALRSLASMPATDTGGEALMLHAIKKAQARLGPIRDWPSLVADLKAKVFPEVQVGQLLEHDIARVRVAKTIADPATKAADLACDLMDTAWPSSSTQLRADLKLARGDIHRAVSSQVADAVGAMRSASGPGTLGAHFGPATPQAAPEGLLLQIAPDAAAPDDDDLADIAGYGLILRRKEVKGELIDETTGSGPKWRMPCLGYAVVSDADPPVLKMKSGGALPVVAPLPIGTVDGRRALQITYDEEPVGLRDPDEARRPVMEDPADPFDFGDDLGFYGDPEGIELPASPAYLRELAKLPALVFGGCYRVAPFVMGRGGVLPPALRADDDVLMPGDVEASADLPTDIAEQWYVRRTPFGAPQVSDRDENFVVARKQTEEIGRVHGIGLAAAAIPTGEIVAKVPWQSRLMRDGDGDVPTVLLSASKKMSLKSEISFSLRAPATDPMTFARWRAHDELLPKPGQIGKPLWTDRATIAVLEAHAMLVAAQDARPFKPMIEDPGVDHFAVTLFRLNDNGTADGNGRTVTFDLDRSIDEEAVAEAEAEGDVEEVLKVIQGKSPKILIKCVPKIPKIPKSPGDDIKPVGDTIEITVQEGHIYEIRFRAVAAREFFEYGANWQPNAPKPDHSTSTGRFHPEWWLKGDQVDLGGGKVGLAGPPLSLRVEAVSHEMPDNDKLYDAAKPLLAGNHVDVVVNWSEEIEIQKWRNVGSLRFEYQAFVPSGRPLPSYPFDAKNPFDFPDPNMGPERNAMVWEAVGFENQEGDPPRRLDVAVPFLAKSAVGRIPLDVRSAGATHYRIGIKASHRYAPLFLSPQSDAWRQAKKKDKKPSSETTWQRFFVPARPNGVLAPPAVRFAVPTLGDSRGSVFGDVLLHVDDPPYAAGGLAEVWEARFDIVGNRASDNEHDWRTAFAPNPILSAKSQKTGWDSQFSGERAFLPLVPRLTIGHSHDLSIDTPRLVAATAMVPCPLASPQLDEESRGASLKWPEPIGVFRVRRLVHPLGALGVDDDPPEAIKTVSDGAFFWASEALGKNLENLLTARADTAKPEHSEVLKLNVKRIAFGVGEMLEFHLQDERQAISILGRVELRATDRLVVATRKLGEEARNASEVEVRWDVGLYLDGAEGRWRPIGGGRIVYMAKPADAAKPLAWSLKKGMDGSGDAVKAEKGAPFTASDWSRPVQTIWANLARARGSASLDLALEPDGAGAFKITAGPVEPHELPAEGERAVRADRSPVKLRSRAEMLAEGWGDDDWQGHYYVVLLLKKVASNIGGLQDSYAPCALFDGTDDNGVLRKRASVFCVNPEAVPEPPVSADGDMAAMILQIQEAPAAVDKKGMRTARPQEPTNEDGSPNDNETAFSLAFLFGSDGSAGAGSEARARIVSVSDYIEMGPK